MKSIYPEIAQPNRSGMLRVSDVHAIHWEESGNPKGKPVLFVHGGPGAGTNPKQRRFFDPTKYRIVLFDQRGCGKSTPNGSLVDNTTWHLVADMEALRTHLGIEKWQVFGGSWGSALSLAYAQTHPERVTELVLRGIFLGRNAECRWLNQGPGTSAFYPDAWEGYMGHIPVDERHDLARAYYRRLTSDDPKVQADAARAWALWGAHVWTLLRDDAAIAKADDDPTALATARIDCHYVVNGCFLESDGALLENVKRIRHIPATIIQGRYDVGCPMENAWALHRAWPEAELKIVPDAGHSAFEPGTAHELVDATDRYAK
ncbi:prolyl aminopeptidase [Pendulispora rubella]